MKRVKSKVTNELILDLNINYGIDITSELERILSTELNIAIGRELIIKNRKISIEKLFKVKT